MRTIKALTGGLVLFGGGCDIPVAAPPPPSGELIAFGGGPGGPEDACFGCHGLGGEGKGATPRLAGVGAGYLAKQIADYANGRRTDESMAPVAKRLSAREARAVADFYGAMPGPEAPAPPPPPFYHLGDAARGLKACAECHGANGLGDGTGRPAIAGQPAPYTEEQMRRWRLGLRRNDPRAVMGEAARALTPAEIEAVAEWLAAPR